MIDAAGFEAPDFDAPLDVQAYVDACLPGQTLKGIFMQAVVDRAKRAGKTLSRGHRFVPFKDYTCADYNRLAEECARAVEPDVTLRIAFRRFGHEAFPAFRETVVGRVIVAAAGRDVPSLIASASKVYGVAITHGQARSSVEGRRAIIELRNIPTFADSFHVGAFEGLMRDCGTPGTVRIRRRSLVDVDLLAEWG